MPFDFSIEPPLTFTEYCQTAPRIGGKRLHPSTLWRWARKGVRGIHLEYVRYGGRIITTAEAVARFSQRLAETDATPVPAKTTPVTHTPRARTSAQRERDMARADRRLAAMGVRV